MKNSHRFLVYVLLLSFSAQTLCASNTPESASEAGAFIEIPSDTPFGRYDESLAFYRTDTDLYIQVTGGEIQHVVVAFGETFPTGSDLLDAWDIAITYTDHLATAVTILDGYIDEDGAFGEDENSSEIGDTLEFSTRPYEVIIHITNLAEGDGTDVGNSKDTTQADKLDLEYFVGSTTSSTVADIDDSDLDPEDIDQAGDDSDGGDYDYFYNGFYRPNEDVYIKYVQTGSDTILFRLRLSIATNKHYVMAIGETSDSGVYDLISIYKSSAQINIFDTYGTLSADSLPSQDQSDFDFSYFSYVYEEDILTVEFSKTFAGDTATSEDSATPGYGEAIVFSIGAGESFSEDISSYGLSDTELVILSSTGEGLSQDSQIGDSITIDSNTGGIMFDDHYSLTFQYVDDEQDSTKAADASHIILELDIQYNDDIRAEWEALGFFVAYNDEDEEDEYDVIVINENSDSGGITLTNTFSAITISSAASADGSSLYSVIGSQVAEYTRKSTILRELEIGGSNEVDKEISYNEELQIFYAYQINSGATTGELEANDNIARGIVTDVLETGKWKFGNTIDFSTNFQQRAIGNIGQSSDGYSFNLYFNYFSSDEDESSDIVLSTESIIRIGVEITISSGKSLPDTVIVGFGPQSVNDTTTLDMHLIQIQDNNFLTLSDGYGNIVVDVTETVLSSEEEDSIFYKDEFGSIDTSLAAFEYVPATSSSQGSLKVVIERTSAISDDLNYDIGFAESSAQVILTAFGLVGTLPTPDSGGAYDLKDFKVSGVNSYLFGISTDSFTDEGGEESGEIESTIDTTDYITLDTGSNVITVKYLFTEGSGEKAVTSISEDTRVFFVVKCPTPIEGTTTARCIFAIQLSNTEDENEYVGVSIDTLRGTALVKKFTIADNTLVSSQDVSGYGLILVDSDLNTREFKFRAESEYFGQTGDESTTTSFKVITLGAVDDKESYEPDDTSAIVFSDEISPQLAIAFIVRASLFSMIVLLCTVLLL